MDKGSPIDYDERLRESCTKMVDADFFKLMDRADLSLDKDEQTLSLYSRAFDIFRLGCERVRQDPEPYIGLCWALFETYRDYLCEDYLAFLEQLTRRHRRDGRSAEEEECKKATKEIKEFARVIDQIAKVVDDADRKRLERFMDSK